MLYMSEEHKQFGLWLRGRRRTLNLSQSAASQAAGISRAMWAKLEAGESGTRRETLVGIARAIGVPLSEAFRRAGFAPPHITSLEDYTPRDMTPEPNPTWAEEDFPVPPNPAELPFETVKQAVREALAETRERDPDYVPDGAVAIPNGMEGIVDLNDANRQKAAEFVELLLMKQKVERTEEL